MDQSARIALAELSRTIIPESPGVYAFYRHGHRGYVGKAASLSERICRNHCSRGAAMSNSALRRNIAEYLKIASSADIEARRYRPTTGDVSIVRLGLDICEVAWIECDTPEAAEQHEASLKAEHIPLFTRR